MKLGNRKKKVTEKEVKRRKKKVDWMAKARNEKNEIKGQKEWKKKVDAIRERDQIMKLKDDKIFDGMKAEVEKIRIKEEREEMDRETTFIMEKVSSFVFSKFK